VVLFDIDLFKKTNDTYGHRVGDELLVVLGRLLTHLTRPGDIACRLGGEEFVLVLPEADLSTAVGRADEIRRAFAAAMVPGLGLGTGPTLSAGAAAFPDHGVTPDELVHAADGALYRAKEMGRNRVCTARGDARS
jgi:diguanylate cyclase (GGDEF)-like protein